jgi:hypothetical protein
MGRGAAYVFVAVLSVAVGACRGASPGSDTCAAGRVRVGDTCLLVCLGTDDCLNGEVCLEGVCQRGGAVPRITGVDGDSPVSDGTGFTAHRVRGQIIIQGENLTAAQAALEAQDASLASHTLVTIASSATVLTAELPGTLAPGPYTLRVSNQSGSDETSLVFVRGEQGAAGTCDASACTSQTFPGATLVTTVRALAVNGGAAEQSLRLGSAEQIDAPANGIYLAVLSRSTHAVATDSLYNRSYDPNNITELQQLVTALSFLDEDDFAILVSRGAVAANMNQVLVSSSLASELIDLGGSERLRAMLASDSFVLAGYRGLDAGNAIEVVGTSEAAALLMLVDGAPLGPKSSGPTVPVGTILPFGGTLAAVPPNWAPCDGRTIAEPSPLLADFDTGTAGVQVPKLDDSRFLMGTNAAGLAAKGGGNAITSDGAHSHSIIAVGYDTAPDYASYDYSGVVTDSAGAHNHGGDRRPLYVGTLFIIRVR